MKKYIVLLALALVMFSGCGAESGERVAHLEDRLALLENTVAELEAEIGLLRSRIDAMEEGSQPEQAMPAEPAGEVVAFLELYDYGWQDSTLTIDRGFAWVRSLGEGETLASCSLILLRGGEALEATALELQPGEALDSYELEFGPVAYRLPELAEGETLELKLEILLGNGRILTALGGSWDYVDGQLMMIAG